MNWSSGGGAYRRALGGSRPAGNRRCSIWDALESAEPRWNEANGRALPRFDGEVSRECGSLTLELLPERYPIRPLIPPRSRLDPNTRTAPLLVCFASGS